MTTTILKTLVGLNLQVLVIDNMGTCFGLLVKEQWRGQGHGEALLKAAIEKCRTRKVSRIMLHVDPLRTPAVNLYKKHGFQVDTLIQGYYSSDRNAYRMYLDLDSS